MRAVHDPQPKQQPSARLQTSTMVFLWVYLKALKMNEASHAPAVGFNCEQFLHGAWAALERDDVVFMIAPPGPSHERCIAAARVSKEVGAPVVALVREDDREIAPLAAETIALPEIDELLSVQQTGGPLSALGVAHWVELIERKRRLLEQVAVITGTEYLEMLEQLVGLMYEKIQPYRDRGLDSAN